MLGNASIVGLSSQDKWSLFASFLFCLTVVRAEQGDPKLAKSVYEFEANDIDGNLVQIKDKYAGNVVVVVNVATN